MRGTDRDDRTGYLALLAIIVVILLGMGLRVGWEISGWLLGL